MPEETFNSFMIDELAEMTNGRYKLTKLVALRLRDINAGAPLLVEKGEDESLMACVCREIREGKISLELPEFEAMEAPEVEMDIFSSAIDETAGF